MSLKFNFKVTAFFSLSTVSNAVTKGFASAALALIMFTAAAVPGPAAAADTVKRAEPVASLETMNGDFEYRAAGADNYSVCARSKAPSMKLYDRDALKTPPNVSGTVETGYGARIELKEKTEIEFGILSVRIKKGDMWINYKRRGEGGNNNFKVLTPAGTIGIKGTEFRTMVADGGDVKIFVSEGVVSFTNNAGEAKTIEAGFGLNIDASGQSGPPIKLEDAGKNNGAAPDNGGVKTGAGETGKDSGEIGTQTAPENKKPAEIENGSDVNTEVNPFE
ncbi:MAG: FecR protein [bacterium ADurb.Bin243]|nr:MAG: FecR protein [bacterium ADurb.Bin243]